MIMHCLQTDLIRQKYETKPQIADLQHTCVVSFNNLLVVCSAHNY